MKQELRKRSLVYNPIYLYCKPIVLSNERKKKRRGDMEDVKSFRFLILE